MSGPTIEVTPTFLTITTTVVGAEIVTNVDELVIDTTVDETTIVVQPTEAVLVTSQSTTAVIVESVETQIVTVAEQGPAGVQGESGGATVDCVYGETISALKVVAMVNGRVYKANQSNAAHAGRVYGVTETAAVSGETGQVRRLGRMQDSSWSWSSPVLFAGDNGAMTGVPPSTGFTQGVARVESTDTVFVDLQAVYEME